MSKYIKLDLDLIRRDFPQVWAQWSDEFEITPKPGAVSDKFVRDANQFIVPGDNESFHFLLTKK